MADRGLPPPALTPTPDEQGLLASGLNRVATRTLAAWDRFVRAIEPADLESGATRSRSRTAKELVIEVGRWPESRGTAEMAADAASGDTDPVDYDATAARLRQAHQRTSPDAVRAAVIRARDDVAAWFESDEAATQAPQQIGSVLGPLPMGTVVHAAAFQLAVTARDLQPAGALPDEELDMLGLAALVDSSGGVAARLRANAAIAGFTPMGAVGSGSAESGGWRTRMSSDEQDFGPGVVAPAGVIVDLAAGRIELAKVLRQVRFRQPHQLRAISVILHDLPNLPGGRTLQRGAKLARATRII